MTPVAKIVYWYDRKNMPRDGGGLRVLAWEAALISLGYSVDIVGINPTAPGHDRHSTILTRTKRLLAPMPLIRPLPPLSRADLYVMTVPIVFKAAAKRVPQSALVFDWMDLWSVNARTMGDASIFSTPGGVVQSGIWKQRERNLPSQARFNTVAGHGDIPAINAKGRTAWLPTPTPIPSPRARKKGPIRRIGFLGNLGYEPNEMSLRKFFRDYGHKLAETELEVVVAGFGSERVKTWDVPATVLGSLDNLDDFYESIDAVIVPIDHGGGIKVKAVEALARGLAVYGTQHVRSGFSPDFAPWIRDINELFFLGHSDRSREITALDHDLLMTHFSQTAFTSSVADFLGRW